MGFRNARTETANILLSLIVAAPCCVLAIGPSGVTLAQQSLGQQPVGSSPSPVLGSALNSVDDPLINDLQAQFASRAAQEDLIVVGDPELVPVSDVLRRLSMTAVTSNPDSETLLNRSDLFLLTVPSIETGTFAVVTSDVVLTREGNAVTLTIRTEFSQKIAALSIAHSRLAGATVERTATVHVRDYAALMEILQTLPHGEAAFENAATLLPEIQDLTSNVVVTESDGSQTSFVPEDFTLTEGLSAILGHCPNCYQACFDLDLGCSVVALGLAIIFLLLCIPVCALILPCALCIGGVLVTLGYSCSNEVVDCLVETCLLSGDPGLIEDCNGNCSPVTFLGDGICDAVFNCPAFSCDDGDCGANCQPVCPGATGDCCTDHPTPGCDTGACCALICGIDPFCCATSWDATCANEGREFCGLGPANDLCQNATILPFDVAVAFDTSCANTDGPPLPISCDEGAGLSFFQDVWYIYTASCTGEVTVETCPFFVNFDTRLAAYSSTSSCPPSNASLVACNDNGPGCDILSEMTFPASEGEQFLVRVGGLGEGGPGFVRFSCGPLCIVDFTVSAPFTSPPRNTCGAVNNCDVPGLDNEDHIYEVFIPSSGRWTFSVCGASYDSKLSVWSDCCLTNIVAADDEGCPGSQEIFTINIAAGTYHVVVDGFANNCGTYVLDVFAGHCPNLTCEPQFEEDCNNCPDCECAGNQGCVEQDDGSFVCSKCGNGTVDPGENCLTCPADVQCDANQICDVKGNCTKCGNGAVDPDENCSNCPVDVVCALGRACDKGLCLPPCPGDVNCDTTINIVDLTFLVSCFGQSSQACAFEWADVDGSGQIDIIDLTLLLAGFGTTCGESCQ